jgi:hypothetical protein
MPRLTLDPNLEVRPDFASAAYDDLCTALAAAQEVDKGAIATRLSDAWDVENNTKKATWEEQVRQDQADKADATLARELAQQLELEERRKEEEAERKEKEKKKPKLKDFVANKRVKDTTPLHPSCYAIHKLDEREYVELYYFTLEGCTEASKVDRTIAQDAFTFTKAEDTLLLKPMASHKPSNKAVPDEDLTWRQMSIAKTTLLHQMSQTGWPENHVIALAEFYLNLESHPTCQQTDGDTILLHYQAQVRREWHEALRSTSNEPAFDISIINDKRVDAIGAEIWNTRRTEGVLRSVHPPSSAAQPKLINHSPPPPPPPLYFLVHTCPKNLHHTQHMPPAPCTLHHVSYTMRLAP